MNSGMKVLIVDDEDDIRRIAKVSLVKFGKMEVVEARSGPEALERALSERPDVILLDVMMPVMDGPTTFKAIRETPDLANIPVVFLTAKAMTSELQHLKDLGAYGVLVKPFNPLTLHSQLRALLEAKRAD